MLTVMMFLLGVAFAVLSFLTRDGLAAIIGGSLIGLSVVGFFS